MRWVKLMKDSEIAMTLELMRQWIIKKGTPLPPITKEQFDHAKKALKDDDDDDILEDVEDVIWDCTGL